MDTALPSSDTDPDKFAFGLMGDPTGDDIAEFGQHCLNIYKNEGWTGEAHNEYFYDNFEKFTGDMLNKIPRLVLAKIRDHLRSNGVYSPRRRGLKIADALFTETFENK